MTSTEHPSRRILVVANETIEGRVLHDTLLSQPAETELLVVAPALNSRLRHWTSDEDRARAAAAERLRSCLRSLEAAGMRADGHVGDADPMLAIDDALALFEADEILIATHPEHRSNWLAHDLVARACARFGLPVAHVVVEQVPAPARALAAA